MATVAEHYEQLLSPVYAWMYGGFEAALERNTRFFVENELSIPGRSAIAVDLGAGCGFQSIPLARFGYKVTAIDLDRHLLNELETYAADLSIACIQDDLRDFRNHVNADIEIVVCMTDTLLHLDSSDSVRKLLTDVFDALGPGGRFVATFRDLTRELEGLDRFIPVRADDNTIFTCFLEYEPETVKVHDLVYTRTGETWDFAKSYYRKLRISEEWTVEALRLAGFSNVNSSNASGALTIVATKPE